MHRIKLTRALQPPRKKLAKPTSSKPSASKAPAPRRSALAKEHGLTAQQETEIRSAFALFSASPPPSFDLATADGALPRSAFRKCLAALGAAPTSNAELRELVDTVDPEESGWIGFEHFVAVAAIKLEIIVDEDMDEEVREAFALFVRDGSEKITLGALKRVARELKEDVDESVLRDMIVEANGGRGVAKGVGLDEFEGVMRRAGAIR